jgi:hypothetical protein
LSPSDLGPDRQLPEEPVSIRLSADPGAELFLLDDNMDLVARGIGNLSASVAPGVYKAKVRLGSALREELISLRHKPVAKDYRGLAFASPVPLAGTSRTHEYHMESARLESGQIHVSIGKGSKLFLFSRDWTPQSVQSDPGHNPAQGLILRDIGGNELVNVEKTSVFRSQGDPCAACSIELPPATYRLGVTLSNGDTYEQTVTTSPGWRTDIFMLQRQGRATRPGKRPDLSGAAISMSQALTFDPSNPETRLLETARLAVANRRPVLEGELEGMLRSKFTNPMLGIFGAHLILMTDEPDRPLLGRGDWKLTANPGESSSGSGSHRARRRSGAKARFRSTPDAPKKLGHVAGAVQQGA